MINKHYWSVVVTVKDGEGRIVRKTRTTASNLRSKEEIERWARLKHGSLIEGRTTVEVKPKGGATQ